MEKWETIKGYEELYEISTLGRVRSLDRNCPQPHLLIRNLKGKYLKTAINNKGYVAVGLQKRGFFIHRLVATAFIPNPLNLPQVNHKNGVKTDNRIENLEWCDAVYNMQHAHKNNLIKKRNHHNENNPNARPIRRIEIKNNKIVVFKTMKEAALKSNTTSSNIGYSLKNKRIHRGYIFEYNSIRCTA
jgi:hypothetical protein